MGAAEAAIGKAAKMTAATTATSALLRRLESPNAFTAASSRSPDGRLYCGLVVGDNPRRHLDPSGRSLTGRLTFGQVEIDGGAAGQTLVRAPSTRGLELGLRGWIKSS